jgi:hypothetical protein
MNMSKPISVRFYHHQYWETLKLMTDARNNVNTHNYDWLRIMTQVNLSYYYKKLWLVTIYKRYIRYKKLTHSTVKPVLATTSI